MKGLRAGEAAAFARSGEPGDLARAGDLRPSGGGDAWSKQGVRLAQNMQVCPRSPVGTQEEEAEVGPTSGPARRLSHFGEVRRGRLQERTPRRRRRPGVITPGQPVGPTVGSLHQIPYRFNGKRGGSQAKGAGLKP